LIHRDNGVLDNFETLCSIPVMTVRRRRLRTERSLENLRTGERESLVVPMMGKIEISSSSVSETDLSERDICYLPKGTSFSLRSDGPADFLWAEAPAEKSFGQYVKRFSEVRPIESGIPPYRRRIFTSLGESDPANRFIAGFVEGESGNWTSFPPHRHDGKPEVYVYYGMGRKFGVQVVASEEEEKAFVVREGDAVLFERGYHPNVATPSVGMNFVWIISADPAERNLAVSLHPEYKDLPMGQTHLTTK
jgi:5-deoxy-glucuronate isomerase